MFAGVAPNQPRFGETSKQMTWGVVYEVIGSEMEVCKCGDFLEYANDFVFMVDNGAAKFQFLERWR
jgi:hypothetical protein